MGIEPTLIALQVRVISITSSWLPDVTTLAMPTYLCGSFTERSAQVTPIATVSSNGASQFGDGFMILHTPLSRNILIQIKSLITVSECERGGSGLRCGDDDSICIVALCILRELHRLQ